MMSRYYDLQKVIPRGYSNLVKSTFFATPKCLPSSRAQSTQAGAGTLYDILKVQNTATEEEIKSSFYRLSKLYHPDVSSSKDAKQLWQDLNDAYNILSNERTRKLYDAGMLEPGGEIRIPKTEVIFPVYEKKVHPLAKKKKSKISRDFDDRYLDRMARLRQSDAMNKQAYHNNKILQKEMIELQDVHSTTYNKLNVFSIILFLSVFFGANLWYINNKEKSAQTGKTRSKTETSKDVQPRNLKESVVKTSTV